MPTTFRPYEPNQTLLLPPDLRDWLPPDHLAYDMADLVDTLDLAPFYAPYEGDGRRNCPYEPAMVKILLYAYATGTFSSRMMARKLEEDVAFRVLAAGNFPRHRTLCEFVVATWLTLRISSGRWCTWRANWGWSSWGRWPSTAPSSEPTPPSAKP